MPRLARHIALALLCALALAACGGSPPPAEQVAKQPKPGDTAPDFSLSTLDGQTVTLASLREQGPVAVVVLRGWVGYQCPLCTKQVGDLVNNAQKFNDKGAKVALIYPIPADSIAQHAQEFAEGKGLPPHILLLTDPDMKFVDAWGLRWNKEGETAYPSTFVVDREGKIAYAKISSGHGDGAGAEEILAALN